MSANTARAHLLSILAPQLPAAWKLIDTARIPQTLERVSVIVNHAEINPTPEARRSTLSNTFEVYVVSPLQDKERADLELDDAVLTVLTAVSDHPEIRFDKARKVDVAEYIGWQINLTTLTAKE